VVRIDILGLKWSKKSENSPKKAKKDDKNSFTRARQQRFRWELAQKFSEGYPSVRNVKRGPVHERQGVPELFATFYYRAAPF
jgi:hypothetical protein